MGAVAVGEYEGQSVRVTDEAPTIDELRHAWSRLAALSDRALLVGDDLPSDLVDETGQLDVARLQGMGWEVTLNSISPPEGFQRTRPRVSDEGEGPAVGYEIVDPPDH